MNTICFIERTKIKDKTFDVLYIMHKLELINKDRTINYFEFSIVHLPLDHWVKGIPIINQSHYTEEEMKTLKVKNYKDFYGISAGTRAISCLQEIKILKPWPKEELKKFQEGKLKFPKTVNKIL